MSTIPGLVCQFSRSIRNIRVLLFSTVWNTAISNRRWQRVSSSLSCYCLTLLTLAYRAKEKRKKKKKKKNNSFYYITICWHHNLFIFVLSCMEKLETDESDINPCKSEWLQSIRIVASTLCRRLYPQYRRMWKMSHQHLFKFRSNLRISKCITLP